MANLMKRDGSDPNERAILDIETTTDHKTIRVVGILYQWNYYYFLNADELRDWMALHPDAHYFTWNGTRFDLDVLQKVWDINISISDHTDLMLVARILYPHERKKSLIHFAKLLGVTVNSAKMSIDYDTASIPALIIYLREDLDMTAGVMSKLSFMTDEQYRAVRCEHRISTAVRNQVNKMVRFDTPAAIKLYERICSRMIALELHAEPYMPVVDIPENKLAYPPAKQFKMDGTLTVHMDNYLIKHGALYNSTTNTVTRRGKVYPMPLTEPFETQRELTFKDEKGIKQYLLDQGWKPITWNYNKDGVQTSPVLFSKETRDVCPGLSHISGAGKWLAFYKEWVVLKHRRSVLKSDKGDKGWIPLAQANLGFLPSDADSCGAVTYRWTHKIIANVPRVSSILGLQFRELFIARPRKVWVGWDASSLEARMEAHYTFPFDKAYANELVNGDVHTRNQAAMGLSSRDHAKTFKYAVTYGAQATKLAKVLGVSRSEGQTIYDAFWTANPALKQLKDELDRHITSRGDSTLKGLDGRSIPVGSQHSQLNRLLQSAGAIVMKYALIIAENDIRKKYTEEQAVGLIRYHDEEIWECDASIAEDIGKIGCDSIRKAGELLGLNVPLVAEYEIGQSWAEVH